MWPTAAYHTRHPSSLVMNTYRTGAASGCHPSSPVSLVPWPGTLDAGRSFKIGLMEERVQK